MQKNTIAIVSMLFIVIVAIAAIYFLDKKAKQEAGKTEKKTVTSTKSEVPIKELVSIFTGGG